MTRDFNKCFTSGEEGILEQACMILNRRKNSFYSREYNYNKKLVLLKVENETK